MSTLRSVVTWSFSAWDLCRTRRVFIAAPAMALGCLVGLSTAAQAPSGAHILAGPDVGKISGSSVTVTWTTDKSKVGEVVWGPKAGKYDRKIQDGLPTADHSITLTGLTRNTTYHFKVKTGDAKSKDGTFTTANYSDQPFTFADMGDNRGPTHDTDMQSVTQSFKNIVTAAAAKKPAFTVHVGDVFHGPGDQYQLDTMYGIFKTAIQPLIDASTFTEYPFTVTPGNHEMSPCHPPCTPTCDPYEIFTRQLPNQPQNGPPGYLDTCFSFDFGNTHVASMDTCHFDGHSTNSDFNFWNVSDAEINWLDQDLAAAQARHVRHIFVFGHAQMWSPDGVVWTSAASGTQADLYGLQDTLQALVAVGASGTIMTSTNGTAWAPVASGTTNSLRSVTAAVSDAQEKATGPVDPSPAVGLVAVGDAGTILTSDLSGAIWSAAPSGTTENLSGVMATGTLYVAVGGAGTILTSGDGNTWARKTSGTTHDLYGIGQDTIGGQSLFVAVGEAGTILTSSDGSTWTLRASGTSSDLYGVTKGITNGQPMFAAVGKSGAVVTSLDGLSWTPQTSGVSVDLHSILNLFMYIAVGDAGTVLTSGDGIHWAKQDPHTTRDLFSIGRMVVDDLHVSSYFGLGAAGTILLSPTWMGDSGLANYQSQRDKFLQVMVSHGVEAYLCGHVHTSNDSYGQEGILQWVCGDSGSTGVGNGHWTLWAIDGDWATAQLLDEDGNVCYIRSVQSRQP
jgi:hypothetical protein